MAKSQFNIKLLDIYSNFPTFIFHWTVRRIECLNSNHLPPVSPTNVTLIKRRGKSFIDVGILVLADNNICSFNVQNDVAHCWSYVFFSISNVFTIRKYYVHIHISNILVLWINEYKYNQFSNNYRLTRISKELIESLNNKLIINYGIKNFKTKMLRKFIFEGANSLKIINLLCLKTNSFKIFKWKNKLSQLI